MDTRSYPSFDFNESFESKKHNIYDDDDEGEERENEDDLESIYVAGLNVSSKLLF
jgi:hypothetical protein